MTIIGCGIDFGSSNTAVALAFKDHVEVVGSSETDTLVPSALYLHRNGRRVVGEPAYAAFFQTGHERTSCSRCSLAPYGVSECRQFRRAGGCNDSRLLWGVKSDLSNQGFAGTNSWATDFPIIELVAITLRALKHRAEEAAGCPIARAVIGHPVVFAGASHAGSEANSMARERLRQSALLAGFTEVELYPEPAAAALAGVAPQGSLLLADFGGGTYDVTVLKRSADGLSLAALEGVDIGGSRFDQVIFETVVIPHLDIGELPGWLLSDLKSLSGVMLLMADPGLQSMLERVGGRRARVVGSIVYGGQALSFYRSIESAKIGLSAHESWELRIDVPGAEVHAEISRPYFEAVVKPELQELALVTERAVTAAELAPADVDVVAVTGGSSQIPAFQRMLRGLYPEAEFRRDAVFTAVVQGLATRARQLWA